MGFGPVTTPPGDSFARQLEELHKDLREVKRDLYGNPQVRQQGVFDRLEGLEERLGDLKLTYERERVEQSLLDRLEGDVEQMKLDYRVMLVYLRGIAGAVAAVFVAVVSAIVVGLLRYWSV